MPRPLSESGGRTFIGPRLQQGLDDRPHIDFPENGFLESGSY